jgi:hypothetical protein
MSFNWLEDAALHFVKPASPQSQAIILVKFRKKTSKVVGAKRNVRVEIPDEIEFDSLQMLLTGADCVRLRRKIVRVIIAKTNQANEIIALACGADDIIRAVRRAIAHDNPSRWPYRLGHNRSYG